MTKPNSEDITPVDRPIANPVNRGLVRALSNHIVVLDKVRQMVTSVRDSLSEAVGALVPHEVTVLAQAMRSESDSAVLVAQEAEALARAGRRGG